MAGGQLPTPLVLQVLSGPNQGAEVPLHDGVYVIGADEDSDFVLSDPELLAAHAQFDVSGGKVHCSARENAPAYLQGVPLDAGGAEVPNFTVLTLGTTHLAIGPAKTSWPKLELPKIAPAPATAPKIDEPAATDEKPEIPVAVSKPQIGDRVREVRRRASRWVTPETLIVSLLVLNILFVWRIWNGQNAGLADLRADESRMDDLLAEFGKQGAILALTKYHGIEGVKGYVKDHPQLARLKSRIHAIQPRTIVRVWDTNTLARSVRQVITTAKLRELQATPGGPGEVVVVGVAPQSMGWQGLQQRVLEQVRPLQHLTIRATDQSLPPKGITVSRVWVDEDEDVAVSLPDWEPPEPDQELLASNVSAKSAERNRFRAMGLPEDGSESTHDSNADEHSTSSAAENLSPESAAAGADSDGVDSASANSQSTRNASRQRAARIAKSNSQTKSKPSLKLDLQSLSVGATQTITLPGAKRLFPGAELADGSQIKTITSEGVTVIQDGTERFYRLGPDIEGDQQP